MNNTVPLKYGLTAHVFTHAQIAAQKRTQARKTAHDTDAQLEIPTPEPS
jgi:hypothetical protein